MSNNLPPDSLSSIDEITRHVRKLAQDGKEVPYEVSRTLNNLVKALDGLACARVIAKEIRELYKELPWLKEADFTFSFEYQSEDGHSFRNGAIEVDKFEINPELDAIADELQGTLSEALNDISFPGKKKGFEAFTRKTSLTDDQLWIYDILNHDATNGPHSLETKRADIDAAFEQGGIDAVAEALLPDLWRDLAQKLDLPYTPVAGPALAVRERP